MPFNCMCTYSPAPSS